ncbi:thioredoxin family protein [Paenibacillus sp. NPDC056579]|uniref:thioredoxin family protein n=1 Tax=Paenibacillus sp. NPDC056579 TaxID=3345871 RepID=UPI00369DADE6
MAILNVSDQNFNQVVLDPNKLVIVDFYADWCGPYRMLSPVLNEIDDKFGDEITIAKVNIESNQKTAKSHQVMDIPTLKFFKAW